MAINKAATLKKNFFIFLDLIDLKLVNNIKSIEEMLKKLIFPVSALPVSGAKGLISACLSARHGGTRHP
jgi:hypothetical protein